MEQIIRRYFSVAALAGMTWPARLRTQAMIASRVAREVAAVYRALPLEDRAVAGIYTDLYATAGAIDQLGPQYGLPHAVSGSLTYYLWGPGYSWDVMIIVTDRTNKMSAFFAKCEQQAVTQREYVGSIRFYAFVCRNPKVPAETIWSSIKSFQ